MTSQTLAFTLTLATPLVRTLLLQGSRNAFVQVTSTFAQEQKKERDSWFKRRGQTRQKDDQYYSLCQEGGTNC